MLFELHILFFPFSQRATTLQVQLVITPPLHPPSFFPSHLALPCERTLSTKHIHLLLFLAQTHTKSVHKDFMCAWPWLTVSCLGQTKLINKKCINNKKKLSFWVINTIFGNNNVCIYYSKTGAYAQINEAYEN